MFERMPWDELRDSADQTEEELANLEEEERQWLAWVDALAEQQPDPEGPILTGPGLVKAYCRHAQYDFALTAETRHAVCRTCGHTWLVVLGDGDTDYLPANLPGVALR